MNIQTFAYSTIINITKKIYEQKKNPNFSKNLSFAYIHEHIYTQRTYIHTYIHFYKNAKKKI